MKCTVAILLVIASLASSEAPRYRFSARQTAAADAEAAPYAPSGWRPSGQAFNLPQRSQRQQTYQAPNSNNAPQGTYGAPQPADIYGPPESVTEYPTTTEGSTEDFNEAPAETIRSVNNRRNEKLKKEEQKEQQAPAFFIIPQAEKLVYAVQSAPLVALPQTKYLTAANLQAVPLTGYQTSVVSPYSGAYVQIYQ